MDTRILPNLVVMDAKEKEMIQKLIKDNSCRVKLADSLVCPFQPFQSLIAIVCNVLDMFSRSGDIGDQSLKWSKIDRNFACFWPQIFFGGSTPLIF